MGTKLRVYAITIITGIVIQLAHSDYRTIYDRLDQPLKATVRHMGRLINKASKELRKIAETFVDTRPFHNSKKIEYRGKYYRISSILRFPESYKFKLYTSIDCRFHVVIQITIYTEGNKIVYNNDYLRDRKLIYLSLLDILAK